MPDLKHSYDVIVIGGGIYGAMVAMESQGRGLQTLLLERNDFGGATSFNNLRTIHGGLRYLQSADLSNFFASVAARRWFLRTFPDLVTPLGCLLLLDGNGARRTYVMRPALQLNDFLSRNRNSGLPVESMIAGGQIIGAKELQRLYPGVDISRFEHAAVWHDATVPDAPRLLIEVLRWAAHKGAHVQNYADVRELVVDSHQVRGVRAQHRFSSEMLEIEAPLVINASGPQVPQTLTAFGIRHRPGWQPSLAWNLVLKRPALSSHAIAVPAPSGTVYFLHPWKGRCMIGTGHALGATREPSASQLSAMLADLNAAVPSLALSESEIEHVLAGTLPARLGNRLRLTRRPAIVDHGRAGGPRGLVSVTGVKFTTSRIVANRLMNRIHPCSAEIWRDRPLPEPGWKVDRDELNLPATAMRLKELASREWVCRMEDLVQRRTNLWEYGADAGHLIRLLAADPVRKSEARIIGERPDMGAAHGMSKGGS